MKQSLIMLSLGIMLFLAACSPQFYAANTQNVPLLEAKGDGNVAIAGNGNQVEFQGSYGVSDQVGLQLNGGLFIPPDLDNGNGGSGNFIEAGVGYFKAINSSVVFETYGLIGFGSVENHFPSTLVNNPSTSGILAANLMRFGIQPSIGYKSKNFDAALSSRFAAVSYSNIKGDLVFLGVDQSVDLNDNKLQLLVEPAVTLRFGLEKIRLQLQLGFSSNLSDSDFARDEAFGTLGINYNFYQNN